VRDDEPVPKLPRGRGLKLSTPELLKIALTAATLVAVIVLAKPCGNAVSGFVMGFEQGSGSAAAQMPKPSNVKEPEQYEVLRPGMTEEETKAAIERAKARANGSADPKNNNGTGNGNRESEPGRK
jgi:hypothetical protein